MSRSIHCNLVYFWISVLILFHLGRWCYPYLRDCFQRFVKQDDRQADVENSLPFIPVEWCDDEEVLQRDGVSLAIS